MRLFLGSRQRPVLLSLVLLAAASAVLHPRVARAGDDAVAALIPAAGADKARKGGPRFRGYVAAPPGRTRATRAAKQNSNIIYLNGCFEGGCVISPGFESSVENRSSIVGSTRTINSFNAGPEKWKEVVDCVRKTYAAFDVVVTDVDPSPKAHFEAIVAGLPAEAGMVAGVAGVAPFDTGTCGVINDAISFSFANVFNGDVDQICWTVAQEVAHTFGLDHEFLCSDPMTYLSDCGAHKEFQNTDTRCGEYTARDCECEKPTQNSYRYIMNVFGPRNPTPPRIGFTEPRAGSRVAPGFMVRTSIEEDIGVASAELRINGVVIAQKSEPPFDFRAPLDVEMGPLIVEVRATDVFGAAGLARLHVVQESACEQSKDCEGGQECLYGRCVAGPDLEGGLGRSCSLPSECSSGLCYAESAEKRLCTEPCLVDQKGCPNGFTCMPAAEFAVCWPSGGGGGCAAATPEAAGLPLLLAIGLFWWRLRRRGTSPEVRG